MIRMHYKIALPAAAALLSVSCASGPFNGPEHSATVAEEHPISVDSQVMTLTIDVDPSVSDLSDIDRARLRAFADAYLNNGHGPLTITAPSGGENDFDGQEAASDIRKALHDAGVPWASLGGATYRTGDGAGQLVLSFTRYVATPSACGVWSGVRSRGYRNLRTPNMGCAVMNNIAGMIAEPRDLVEASEMTPRDGAAVVRAIDLYRSGEVTASEIDQNIDTQVSQ